MGRPLLGAGALLGLVLIVLGSVASGAYESSLVQSWQDLAAGAGRARPPVEALREAAALASSDTLRLGTIVLAITLVLAAWARGRLPRAAVIGLVGLFLLVDLWRVDQPLLHPQRHLSQLARQGSRLVAVEPGTVIRSPDEMAAAPDAESLAAWLHQRETRPRVWPLGGPRAQDNVLAAESLVSLGGYYAAKLKTYQDYRERLFSQRPATELANLLAAGWLLAPQPFSEGTIGALEQLGLRVDPEPAYDGPEGVLYRNLSAGPRAWMVHDFELEGPGRDTTEDLPGAGNLDRLLAPDFDPRATALLSAAPERTPGTPSRPAAVEVRDPSHHRVEIDVDSDAAGVLVVADIWYPEWQVYVDGQPRRLLRANHALRAVELEAGEHQVEFRYVASAHRRGTWIRDASLVLIVVGGVLPAVWRRRRKLSETRTES